MKTIDYLKVIPCLSLSLLLASCKVENEMKSENLEIEKLKKEILGEWVFREKNARSNSDVMSIEFLETNTYVAEVSDTAVSNTYEIRNAGVISLKELGEIQNITLREGRLDFTLSSDRETYSVSADKSPEMEKDEKTNLLCKRWRLLAVENAVDSLTWVDRSYMSFTKSGSYITENYSRPDSPRPSTLKMKWKWHPTIENRIQYWDSRRDGPKVEREYIDIRELTEKSLKITYSNSTWSGNFSFIPEP